MFIIDDILGAIFGGNAAAAQERATKEAMDLQRQMYQQSRDDMQPWRLAGVGGLQGLQSLLNDPSSIQNSPAFQFRMAEGQKALERSAAARGGLAGGGFMKGLARYSQGLASEEYGNQYNRLANLAGMGQSTAQNLGALGANYANSMSNLYGAKGNAQAAGQQAIGQGIAGGLGSLGRLASFGLGGGFNIPTQEAYGAANPASMMINPATMPNPFG